MDVQHSFVHSAVVVNCDIVSAIQAVSVVSLCQILSKFSPLLTNTHLFNSTLITSLSQHCFLLYVHL